MDYMGIALTLAQLDPEEREKFIRELVRDLPKEDAENKPTDNVHAPDWNRDWPDRR